MPSIRIKGAISTYMEFGAGDTVILLHSGGGGAAQWKKVITELDDRLHIIAPDLRGYGGSDMRSSSGIPTLSSEASVVHAFARNTPGNIHLVGHSYGGSVALKAAAERPEIYASLTLIEPANFNLLFGGPGEDDELFAEISRIAMKVTKSVSNNEQEDGLRAFVDYWGGQGKWESLRSDVRHTLCNRAKVIAYNFYATMFDKTPFKHLVRHGLPTLFIKGEETTPVTARITDILAAATPGARVQPVQEAGHMSPISHPSAISNLILDHTARTRAIARAAA